MFAACVLAAGVCAAAAEVELAPRYIDAKNGFSLRPPAGADRNREFSPRRLVRWSVRDPKTKAIAWTLTVRRESARDPGVTLKGFADALARALARRKDVRVESVIPARVLDKDALYVRTEHGTRSRRWQYELWVLADAKRFLVLAFEGPMGMKDDIETSGREVIATLRLTDPVTLAAARKVNLGRGRAFLAGLTEKKFLAAAGIEPLWYLYRRGGRDIGYFHVAAAAASRGFTKGIEVRTFARIKLKGGQVMHLSRTMFFTRDRAREDWRETARVRRAREVIRKMSEEGRLRDGSISCKVSLGGKSQTRHKAVPPPTAAHYLPRALAVLLPRLVDLAKPAAYAFAGYTTAANDFDMRTFTVAGREKITHGARTVEAIRAADQVAADAEAATLYLRPDGAVLRMQTAAGIVMELAGRSAVLRRFADAESAIKAR